MNVLLTAANWGPIGVWAGAAATAAATGVALLSGTGQLDRYRQPHLSVSFEHAQPWTRHVTTDGTAKLWLRVSVDNTGRQPARGCVGHLTALATDDVDRADIDPVQLRWAGVPLSRSFHPVDLRRGQREYLNIVHRDPGGPWQIDTFTDPDFDPGFPTTLNPRQAHRLSVTVSSDNAKTTTVTITLRP